MQTRADFLCGCVLYRCVSTLQQGGSGYPTHQYTRRIYGNHSNRLCMGWYCYRFLFVLWSIRQAYILETQKSLRKLFYYLISQGFESENLPKHRKRAIYQMLQKHFAGATSVAVRELSICRHVAAWTPPRKQVGTWRFRLAWCRTKSMFELVLLLRPLQSEFQSILYMALFLCP